MGADRATKWVEAYLYSARGHRALEQSVFAEGERNGFSERKLCRAGQSLDVQVVAGCWELPTVRAAALDARRIRSLGEQSIPESPRRRLRDASQAHFNTPIRLRRAA
jgi:hypothetical protein